VSRGDGVLSGEEKTRVRTTRKPYVQTPIIECLLAVRPYPLQHDNHAAAEAVRNGHPSFGCRAFAMNSPGESRERKTSLERGCVATSSIATGKTGF